MYRLSAFIIMIAAWAVIKYLGKDISNFYIEGLDLLGGQYNIATNNIPASYVSTVQVLNNHNAAKIDKGTFSDDVALNVKLFPNVKFRPVGTMEAVTGYGDEWLYQLSGAGMLFNSGFQAIATAKIGNIDEFSMDENTDHYEEDGKVSYARKILGDLSASDPPLARNRYLSPGKLQGFQYQRQIYIALAERSPPI